MMNLKTISLITVAIAMCGFSNTAFAQSATIDTAHQDIIITAANTQPKVKRKIRRVVEPLPLLAKPKASEKTKLFARAPYSKAVNGHMNKFVIKNGKHKVLTPVYFSEDALKSR